MTILIEKKDVDSARTTQELKAESVVVIAYTNSTMVVNASADTAAARLMIPPMTGIQDPPSLKLDPKPTENVGASTRDARAKEMDRPRARRGVARLPHLSQAIFTTSPSPLEEGQDGMTMTMLQSSLHLHDTMMIAVPRKRRRSALVACSASLANPKRTWVRLRANPQSRGMMRKKKASVADGSTGQTVALHTGQTMTMHVLQSRLAAVARNGAVVPREEKVIGGIHMMTRYIALLMRDSIIVTNVIRMNVDIVFIGPRVPSIILAFACR
jgi:hypothetical protein